MSKRHKQQGKPKGNGLATNAGIAGEAARGTRPSHPPAKNPTLLAVSVVLFALWFAFLLVTALIG